jgi:hypothetical protein
VPKTMDRRVTGIKVKTDLRLLKSSRLWGVSRLINPKTISFLEFVASVMLAARKSLGTFAISGVVMKSTVSLLT